MNSTKSIATLALSLVLTSSVAATAFADDQNAHPQETFPMKGDAFQQKVEARLAKHKAHVEQRITEQKVDDTKAKEMRARYDEHAAKVRAAVATVIADGTVTKEEAQTVREASGHRGHGPGKANK